MSPAGMRDRTDSAGGEEMMPMDHLAHGIGRTAESGALDGFLSYKGDQD